MKLAANTLEALVRRQHRAYLALKARLEAHVAQVWKATSPVGDADRDRWVTQVTPSVQAAQRAAVLAAAGTMDLILRAAGEDPRVALDPDKVIATARGGGVTPAEVYARPVVDVRVALAAGLPLAVALSRGLERAQVIAGSDVMLANRQAFADYGAEDDRITGWNRVPDGHACQLCLLASDQRYSRGDLLPIHDRCGCTVAPILSSARLYPKAPRWAPKVEAPEVEDPAGETRTLEVAVRTHGELGPVLTDQAHDFTGPRSNAELQAQWTPEQRAYRAALDRGDLAEVDRLRAAGVRFG